jgi:DNA modification methylase
MSQNSTKQFTMFEDSIPVMPEGYYSGDKPNPNMKVFVERYIQENPYNPETDDYDVLPFDRPIETTKATAIYNMHTYWSKKPHDAIRQYIRHYTKPGDLVLDPFCGSGGTALAALMEGRKAIAIDRSPAATFITKNYCTPVDVEELQAAFEDLKTKVKQEIDWLYETRCDRCGGKATTNYTVYSQVFECPRCLEKVPLFDCVEVQGQTAKGKPRNMNVCPNCYKHGITEEIKTSTEKFGAVPVLVSYKCLSGCKPASETRKQNDKDMDKREYFNKYDIGRIEEIEAKTIPYWFPDNRMMNIESNAEPWGDKWRAGTSNFRTVMELFTKRNLWALAIIKNYITATFYGEKINQLLFPFSASMLGVSKMVRESNTATMAGTYYFPQISKEVKVLSSYINKFNVAISGWNEVKIKCRDLLISTNSSTNLSEILTNSVDYIFTDPPYAGKVQYGELNFIWESWMGFDTHWHNDEIIINETRKKTEGNWFELMLLAMHECYRVLKPGRCISLCYHDTSEGTWTLVQDIMAEVGFIIEKTETALYIDTDQKSYNQMVADKVTKRDLVINFRKPKPGEAVANLSINGQEDVATFTEKVRTIIRDYLNSNPGYEKNRIYDEVVSHMVQSGQMEAHDFDEILNSVAEESAGLSVSEASRWYLRETEMTMTDEAEVIREDNVAQILGQFIASHLNKHREEDGVHYSDLFEKYIYSVKDKPRRQMIDILPDYFYKTDDGTWRLPATEDEENIKKQARTKGLGRRVKRYVAMLESGEAIPEKEQQSDATLAEWLRYCKRAGLYKEGRLIYEIGGFNIDNLPEEVMAAVEEDYQTCCRMLIRSK